MSMVIQTGFLGNTYDINNPRIGFDAHSATGTATSSATGADPDWVTDGETWTVWEGGNTSATLTITFPSSYATGYVGLAAHNLGSTGASVTLQTSTDGGSFTTPTGLSAHEPQDDSAIMWLFATTNLRAVRFVISGGSLAPQVAVAQAGEVLEVPQRSVFTELPISESEMVTYRHQQSVTGDVLGRAVLGSMLEFTLTINNLAETFRGALGDITWTGFRTHVKTVGPFFIATKPLKYPDDVAYARCKEHPKFERNRPNAKLSGSVSLECMGYRAP